MSRNKTYSNADYGWIGKIPDRWSISRVGKFFIERSEKVDDINYPPLSVTMSGVIDQLSDIAKTNDGDNRKLVKKNDFVINSRSDRKGSSGIAPRDGSVSLINIVLELRDINPKFVQYLFKSYYFKEEFFRQGKGIHLDLWSTRWDQLKNINIPIPPLNEQKLIANYLDQKISKIDLLINKINQKIKLLKEQRLNLINKFTLSGLNYNSETKETGIEWIGLIPKHWSIIRSKYIFKNKSLKDFPNEPLLSVTQIQGVVMRSESSLRVWNPENDISGYKLIEPGNFVISLRSFEGGLELSQIRGLVSPAYTVLERTRTIHEKYFWWLMKSKKFIVEINKHVSGIREGKNIGWDDFSNIYLTFPPIKEQIEISDFLVLKTTKIDKMIKNYHIKINLLNEYKNSIVSEVVTGKLNLL